jgi:hypothetical protein
MERLDLILDSVLRTLTPAPSFRPTIKTKGLAAVSG